MAKDISVEEARKYLLDNLDRPRSIIMNMSDKAVMAAFKVTTMQFDAEAI